MNDKPYELLGSGAGMILTATKYIGGTGYAEYNMRE